MFILGDIFFKVELPFNGAFSTHWVISRLYSMFVI